MPLMATVMLVTPHCRLEVIGFAPHGSCRRVHDLVSKARSSDMTLCNRVYCFDHCSNTGLCKDQVTTRISDPIPDTNTWICQELRTDKAELVSHQQARTKHVRRRRLNIVSTNTVRKSQTVKMQPYESGLWTQSVILADPKDEPRFEAFKKL